MPTELASLPMAPAGERNGKGLWRVVPTCTDKPAAIEQDLRRKMRKHNLEEDRNVGDATDCVGLVQGTEAKGKEVYFSMPKALLYVTSLQVCTSIIRDRSQVYIKNILVGDVGDVRK